MDYAEEHEEAGCLEACNVCGDLMAMQGACSVCHDNFPKPVAHEYHGWVCSSHTPAYLATVEAAPCQLCGAPIGPGNVTRLRRGHVVHWRCAGLANAGPAVTEVPDVKIP